MKFPYLSILALIAILAGCSGSTSTSETVKQTTGTPSAPESSEPSAPKGPVVVPEDLKHDGYAYFGLANEKTMDVELRVEGQATKTGGITIAPEKVEDGKVYYKVERTGAIADDLGTDTVIVDKTGVYVAGNTIATITPAQNLQLPAKLDPGTKWESKSTITRTNSQELKEESTYKVVGTKDITTKVSKYSALLVTSTGTATVTTMGNTRTAKYETKAYYVKDRGLVKAIFTMTFSGAKPTNVTIEETK